MLTGNFCFSCFVLPKLQDLLELMDCVFEGKNWNLSVLRHVNTTLKPIEVIGQTCCFKRGEGH